MTAAQTDVRYDSADMATPRKTNPLLQVGVVAIGRNEGVRIDTCIRSAVAGTALVLYVDSGSTDDSMLLAERAGAESVGLDMSLPFTAARARNQGYRRLRQLAPELSYIQFVDGDCEIEANWIETASAFLDLNQDVGVICGRRRERFPSRSIYNRLCDLEWDTPIGQAKACGGDALMRADAFEQVAGYRDELIAGEEPELCLRLRAAGWKIWRLDAEMTQHDAAILHFSQWWRRHVRSGYAFAQGAYLHGQTAERHWVWETLRALFWGTTVPIVSLLALALFGPWGLLPLLIYPLQFVRRLAQRSEALGIRSQLTFFELLTRFPESSGVFTYMRDLVLGRHGRLIEYK
jgi:glycosyltransferase involved in cell wall biosynthesis